MRMILSIFITMMLMVQPVSSHHSRSEFADEITEIEGVLIEVHWRNPHAGLDIEVINDDGTNEMWRVETFGSPNLFGRMGVKREHFKIGETIKVAGNASTKRPHYMLGKNALFEDGLEAVMVATIGPRWSRNHVGGEGQSDADPSQIVDAKAENLGIFRVWSIAGRNIGVKRHYPYTDTAREAMKAWDPLTAPVARCEEPGMPVPMTQPLSFVFTDEGDTLKLQMEYFGTVRTIHINSDADPATQPASPLGYSVGRWEDDTLLVETTRINYPWFNSAGAPQSEDVRVTERFELSDDQTQLMYRLRIDDPVTFTETAISERLYFALGAPFLVLDCTLF